MKQRTPLLAALAAATLSLAACDREQRIPMTQSDTTPSTTTSESQGTGALSSGTSAPTTTAAGTGESSTQLANASPGLYGAAGPSGGSTTGDGGAPQAAIANTPLTGNNPGAATTGALAPADQQFLTQAAEGGQYELEVAKLAVEKASDPAVKAFAQMLVDDHAAANGKLRQIASGHQLALPASLPEDRKRELDQMARLSGPAFDRQFIQAVGLQDHQHDIAAFEKAGQAAQAPDVKQFAQDTLPALKKHLAAAQKLPAKG